MSRLIFSQVALKERRMCVVLRASWCISFVWKAVFIPAPVHGMPTDGSTFYLDCDVSNIGLAAVLSHNQNGSKVVIGYTSRA